MPAPDTGASRRGRLLFVHAHPDDETLTTGVTHGRTTSPLGDDVHVLTCTLGEEGEVIPPHAGPPRAGAIGPPGRVPARGAARGDAPARGHARGARGGPRRRRPLALPRLRHGRHAGSAEDPRAFVNADLGEAAGLVAEHIARVRPDVVVTYDEHGGYAHPDHIRTHQVTMAALRRLDADGEAPLVYAVLTPRSWAVEDREWLARHVDRRQAPHLTVPGPDDPFPPSVVPDEVVTHEVVRPDLVPVQAAALAAHEHAGAGPGRLLRPVQRRRRTAARPRGLRAGRPPHRPAARCGGVGQPVPGRGGGCSTLAGARA